MMQNERASLGSESNTVEQPDVITDIVDDGTGWTTVVGKIMSDVVFDLDTDEDLPDDYKHIPALPIIEDDPEYNAVYRTLYELEPSDDETDDIEEVGGMLQDELASERIVMPNADEKIADIESRYGDGLLNETEYWQQKAYVYSQVGDLQKFNACIDALNNAIAHADDPVEEPHVTFEDVVHLVEPTREERREQLLKEVREFYELLDMPSMGRNFAQMDDITLEEHLGLLRKNNGGSLKMAELIQQTEIEYDNLLKSETLKMRMTLIEQKSVDTIAMMQKLRSVIGNDFVIGGVKASDYHLMLKSAVSFISVIHDKTTMIGQQLGIKLPVNELNKRLDSIPIVENMPADPRIAMCVLNALMAYMDKFHMLLDAGRTQNMRSEDRIRALENREKFLAKNLDDAQAYKKLVEEQYEKYVANSAYWIIKDSEGRILRQVNPEEPIRHTRDLDLRGDYDTALVFPSRTQAHHWRDRLMGTRRFRNHTLKVNRVSVVEDN